MLSDEWLSRYGLLENFNASVTRTGTGTWMTGVTAIALCISCSRAKNENILVKIKEAHAIEMETIKETLFKCIIT